MVVDRPRRWRRVLTGALTAAAVGGLWFLVVSRSHEAQPLPVRSAAVASTGVTAGSATSVAAVAVTTDPAAQGAEGVEVCGLGWVTKPAEGDLDGRALMDRSGVAQARQRILAKLRSDASEFARATALLLAMTSSDGRGWFARIGLAPDDHANARDQLARLAAASTDPKVYALAYKACGANANAGVGACQLINAAQWARLDPDNAAPWLFMLWTATTRKDRAAQDEALHRIASAKHERLGYFAAAGAILDATPDDDGAQLAAWMMVTEVIGVEAAVGLPGLTPLVNACKGDALADANRRQTCSAVAEVLTERSDTVFDRRFGTVIGKNSGWPTERHERLAGEYAAYSIATLPTAPSAEDLSCATLRRDTDRVRRAAAVGENAALRDWVAQSGKQPEDFIREERTRQKQARRATHEAAASAAAASAGR